MTQATEMARTCARRCRSDPAPSSFADCVGDARIAAIRNSLSLRSKSIAFVPGAV